jgi:hypothetical protein
MPGFVILALLGSWLFVSYQVYQAGSRGAATVLALTGLALALWRFWRSES